MPLVKDPETQLEDSEREIFAMAFRDDRSAANVAISKLSFEGCRLSSTARFDTGEHLRLHVRNQGWIEAQVQSVSGDISDVLFVTHRAD